MEAIPSAVLQKDRDPDPIGKSLKDGKAILIDVDLERGKPM
jgi:hypothetical protein